MMTKSTDNQVSNDRRIRKTRQALKIGLLELMLTKSPNEISVRELTEKVDINRGTFYLHYKDIYDLIEQIENETLEEFCIVLTAHVASELVQGPLPLLDDMFDFLTSNSSLCAVLLGEHGDIAFINKLKTILKETCFQNWSILFGSKKLSNYNYFFNFILSGCLSMFEIWLNTGQHETSHELALLANSIIVYGVDVLK